MYKPLVIETLGVAGKPYAMRAMRLPKNGSAINSDEDLVKMLIKRGDSHAKCLRGIVVWAEVQMQGGFMLEWDTYRIGREVLSTSSSMHNELKDLMGAELAEQKQRDLVNKVYIQDFMVSYQTLRKMWVEEENTNTQTGKYCATGLNLFLTSIQ